MCMFGEASEITSHILILSLTREPSVFPTLATPPPKLQSQFPS